MIDGMATALRQSEGTLNQLAAAEIRAWQGRKMVTGRELARRLGVDQKWVSNRVRGEIPISLNDLQRIAAALQVSVRDLLPDGSAESPMVTTGRCSQVTERPMIPRQRPPTDPPFGGGRTRPLQDIDLLAEPNRVVPGDFSPDRLGHFDPNPLPW